MSDVDETVSVETVEVGQIVTDTAPAFTEGAEPVTVGPVVLAHVQETPEPMPFATTGSYFDSHEALKVSE